MPDIQKFFTRKIVIASAVFLLALVVRLVFIWQWKATPYGAVPFGDSHAYDLWAQDIVHGQLLSPRAFYMSPLYPYILALLYGIFGHSFLAAALFNALLDTLSCAILSMIAFGCFGFEAAILTGVLAAFDRDLIFYTAPLMKESLGFFLTTLFLAVVLRALKNGGTKYFFLSGALLGLLALTRGNALLLAPVIVLLAYTKHGPVARALASAEEPKTQSLRSCAAFALATMLFILPATIHNAIVSHDFVLMNYDGGLNFHVGNSPSATGTIADVAEDKEIAMWGTITTEEEWTTHYAEQISGRTLRPSEVSAFWRDRAFVFIAQNPRQSLSLLLEKLRLFLYGGNLPDNYNIGFITKNFPTILSLPLPGFFLVSAAAAFSLIGLWHGRNREAVATLAILAGVYMLSVLIFYVTERYRLPIEAFLLPLAGAAVPCAWELLRFRRWGRLITATALTGLLFIVELCPGLPDPGDDPGNPLFLGQIYHDLGDYQDALQWYRKAAVQGSASAQFNSEVMYSVEAQFNLGIMYQLGQGVTQDYVQAMKLYRKAAEHDLAPAQYNLGCMYYEGKGVPPDYAQAILWIRKAAEHGFASAQLNLGVMYARGEGVPRDTQQAIQWLRKAAAQGNAKAQHNLAVLSHAGDAMR